MEADARRILLGFEADRDPFRHLVRGHSVWAALRFTVWAQLKIALGDLSPLSPEPPVTGRLGQLWRDFGEWRTYRSLAAGRYRCDVLALTSSSRLREPEGDRWRNTYYDYFAEPLPATLQYYINSKGRREPYADASVFVSTAAHRTHMNRIKRSRFEGRDAAAALHAEFSDYSEHSVPGVSLPLSSGALEHEVLRFGVLYDAMTKVLEGTGARLVLSDCYYDRTWAVAAARSLGIPVLELQHGIVYDGHVAYQFDPASISAHREKLPVPDRVLSFGPESSAVFAAGGAWGAEDIIDAGFPRMARQQHGYTWGAPRAGEPLVLLISSQWILASRLRKYLVELSAQLPSGIDIRVKPHPGDVAAAYDGIERVSVVPAEDDFYRALRGAHLHASAFSTTLVESVGLGVPTVVLGLPGAENARVLEEKGSARRVDTPGEMAALLEHCRDAPSMLLEWQRETKGAAPRFWSPDPEANIRHQVEAAVTRLT